MPKTDEAFLSDRINMTRSEGWLDLVEELQNLENNIVNLDSINFILSLDTSTNLALEELQDGNPT